LKFRWSNRFEREYKVDRGKIEVELGAEKYVVFKVVCQGQEFKLKEKKLT